MTATIHRIYSAPPIDDLPAKRAEWSANRKAQEAAGVGVFMPLPRGPAWLPWVLSAGLVVVFGVYQWVVA